MKLTIGGRKCSLVYPKKGTVIHEIKTYLEGTLYVSYRVVSPPPDIRIRITGYRWVDNAKTPILTEANCEVKPKAKKAKR